MASRKIVISTNAVMDQNRFVVGGTAEAEDSDSGKKNLALVMVASGPLHDRPEQFVASHLAVARVHWLHKETMYGQRAENDAKGGAIWSMVARIPYESFSDATMLHPDMGIEMRHRRHTMGRPTLSLEKHHFF